MTTDVFYAILKLVSGEELLAKVCAFEEEGEVFIVLDTPIIVNIMMNPKSKSPIVKVVPWVSLSTDNTHIIKREHVITMTEVKDASIVKIHNQYVNDISNIPNINSFSKNTDYVKSVIEAKRTLEELYNSKESHSNFE